MKVRITLITAPYCGRCRTYFMKEFEPVKAQIEWLGKQGVELIRVDGFEHPEIARKFKVTTVPTVVIEDLERRVYEVRFHDDLPKRAELCHYARVPDLGEDDGRDYC